MLGIVGVIVAAPGLASITMLGRYVVRKMLDLDPWPEEEEEPSQPDYLWMDLRKRALSGFKKIRNWFRRLR
jgi:hypothetical protein